MAMMQCARTSVRTLSSSPFLIDLCGTGTLP
jgi:hypothetical protein